MDLKAPYAGIKNNLLLTKNGEVWAYYRIIVFGLNLFQQPIMIKKKRQKNE